jgi:hypothetical protein
MPPSTDTWLRWAPRFLGTLVCLFLGLFALDATSGVDLLIHLAPAAAVGLFLAVAWRWPALGGAGFLAVAATYAAAAWRQPTWIAAIAGPLVLTGALFITARVRMRPGTK